MASRRPINPSRRISESGTTLSSSPLHSRSRSPSYLTIALILVFSNYIFSPYVCVENVWFVFSYRGRCMFWLLKINLNWVLVWHVKFNLIFFAGGNICDRLSLSGPRFDFLIKLMLVMSYYVCLSTVTIYIVCSK